MSQFLFAKKSGHRLVERMEDGVFVSVCVDSCVCEHTADEDGEWIQWGKEGLSLPLPFLYIYWQNVSQLERKNKPKLENT